MSNQAVATVLVPMKFLFLISHLLAIMTTNSCKEQNIVTGLAKDTPIDSTAFSDAKQKYIYRIYVGSSSDYHF